MWRKKGVDLSAMGFSRAEGWVRVRFGAAPDGTQRGGRILERQPRIAPGDMSSA